MMMMFNHAVQRPAGFQPSGHLCITAASKNAPGNAPLLPPDPTALKDGTTLLRLHHIYGANESTAEMQAAAVVDLAGLFANGNAITDATELTLSAIQPLANLTRLAWNLTKGNKNKDSAAAAASSCMLDRTNGKLAVTVNPMDICTFSVVFAAQ